MTTVYDFTETEMSNQPIDFNDYKGKVVLIVNTASKCGFTPQLTGLEALYKQYKDKGFEVLGLPSNQFNQELDSDEATHNFCQMHFGVTFPMTKHVKVNGEGEDGLYTYLKSQAGHGPIEWNFTKFLVGRDGEVLGRFAPGTPPESLEPTIIAALGNVAED
ncbi:glutathione peroxidase [Levilactobacillus paucivorans]|uniref:Glutathione peroxidase n=1 Tax=Levilactobacillus paucivorans TaxID=616990 RepID=A0A0R2LT05_9LACO|nr:glutathione peroxidase [Levilactobacillus paucivorans]KRO04782.1 glutathione peroxidase [Levilactobacillus paucivorans]